MNEELFYQVIEMIEVGYFSDEQLSKLLHSIPQKPFVAELQRRLQELGHSDDMIARTLNAFRTPRRMRWRHADYARLIGCSSNLDDIQEEISGIDRIYPNFDINDPTHLWGFWRAMHNSKVSERNGWYRLRIYPGEPNNQICWEFRAVLTQFPSEFYTSAPQIQFPPRSSNRLELIHNTNLIEISSMSLMMRTSMLQNVQAPVVFFRLNQLEQENLICNYIEEF